MYSRSEILSFLAFVLGRTEKEFISEPMGSHGRKPRINFASSLPEQERKHYPNHGEDKGLHERMVELLWDSGHEEQHRKPERMAIPQDTDVYLETVETAQNRRRKLIGLGLPEWEACEGAYSRKSYWRMSNTGVVKRALTKERLINWGFYDLATAYQSVHVNY